VAVERYAVQIVRKRFEEEGYTVVDVGAFESWDLTARRRNHEVHIEVKGSTVERLAVDLTEGEVRHALANSGTVLAVVDCISMDERLSCSGGRLRTWTGWSPDRNVLTPTAYRYPLPLDVDASTPREP
jgi:hypothetical protein